MASHLKPGQGGAEARGDDSDTGVLGDLPTGGVDDRRARGSLPLAEVKSVLDRLPRLDIAHEPDVEFSIDGVLGTGGMGVVSLARQRFLGREVAIKQLRREVADNPGAAAALLAEAQVQGMLDHPNIIPLHTLGRAPDGLPALVMKRISGVSWRALIYDTAHPAWSRIAGDRLTFHLETLMQVSNAVHFAHTRAIVHRDIKPENVVIGSFGEVYLLDWGLAVRLGERAPRDPGVAVSGAYSAVGTPAYMAPEMVDGSSERITARTDVFLLGATLHEVLTRSTRHRGDSVEDLLAAATDPRPVAYPPSVPAELAALCNAATSADPAGRPTSALAFREAIAEFLRHRGSISLADAAAARLAELRQLSGRPRPAPGESDLFVIQKIHALFSAAHFGFTEALRTWKDNAVARAGLDSVVTCMIDIELSRRNVEGAAALLAELPAPAPELVTRIEALRTSLVRERVEVEQLKRFAIDVDMRVSFRPRRLAMAGSGALIGAMALSAGAVVPSLQSHWLAILVLCIITSSVTITLLVGHNHLFTNQGNRRIWLAVLAGCVLTIINHGFALAMDGPLAAAVITDLLLEAAIGCAMVVDRFWGLQLGALTFLLGAVAAVLLPQHAVQVAAGANLLAFVVYAFVDPYALRAEQRASPPQ